MENGLLIGELAQRSGLSRKALRLYEALGILPPAKRTPSGYRRYPADVLGLLTFVGQARRVGLTLGEIKRIVALRRAGSPPCTHVRTLLQQKAADLEGMLIGIRSILASWSSTERRLAAICPHIEGKGGEVKWTSTLSRSARRATTAQKSSSMAIRSASARRRTSSSSRRTSGTSWSTPSNRGS